jgi:hypothetical protein
LTDSLEVSNGGQVIITFGAGKGGDIAIWRPQSS